MHIIIINACSLLICISFKNNKVKGAKTATFNDIYLVAI